jgi:coenzyme F420-reducing hydrogenase beta subunit
LPNIYRALEFRDEATIYDRLAVSVIGETLTDVYLEQRRALEMEERGGAQARVEAVEVLEAREIESRNTGFAVRSTWTVGGMVTHFGHRHFRQNRYDARIGIVPDAGNWKIQSIEVLEQERVR